MWTTAGAIFSTTSAMKLNLNRGLVSGWRPARTEAASGQEPCGARQPWLSWGGGSPA